MRELPNRNGLYKGFLYQQKKKIRWSFLSVLLENIQYNVKYTNS